MLLQGKNGGGKTTFLRLLAGLDKPDTGNLRIAMREEAVALQEEVSLNMEVAEVADAVSKNAGISKNDFYKVLEALGENNLEKQKLHECSGGQRKKCYLAFALVKPADMLILDEPTNHLDDKSVQYLMDFLNEYKKTLVVCSHDERIEKLSWTKKYVMEEGILHEQ